jgi:hypothetical protein
MEAVNVKTENELNSGQFSRPQAHESQQVLLAETPAGITIGVITDSEPSSLSLLACGVAGMAARHERRERTKTK